MANRARMSPEEAWQAAITIVGGKAEMAREIGVTPQRLQGWKKCHPEFVLKTEEAVGAAMARIRRGVDRFDLRPDIYPRGTR